MNPEFEVKCKKAEANASASFINLKSSFAY
ncbi:TPA: hypothetical protein I7295_19125 [Vibrio parahaemolyticus]|nr:hypothetical protein [Vibrio parahaemolyticus]EGQ9518156.1 hypothetical protein [Vibrio parahaemolyticus]EGR1383582.1 hypothetical protein [Vibrio parahaemolyticus]EGR4671878.1 hypothetical protein [Vibrio parahaemolyticus]HAS6464319.1 hypothetical protein [Vibrio parahaemolyticus]